MYYSNLFNGYIFVSFLVYNLTEFCFCRPSFGTNDLSQGGGCLFQNNTYALGERFEVDCDKKCKCGLDGTVYCEPRCPLFTAYDNAMPLGRCIDIRNPLDECCVINVCGSSRAHGVQSNPECVYSDWSPWSACTAPCGKDAVKLRTRTLLSMNSLDELGRCNERLETVKCSLLPCNTSTGGKNKMKFMGG